MNERACKLRYARVLLCAVGLVVCVCVSFSGAVRCRSSLTCLNVDWWLRTVDLVCLVWASSGAAASCCMGLVRGC